MTSKRIQRSYSLMRSIGLILVVLAGSGLLAGSSCHNRDDDDDCHYDDDDWDHDCHDDDDDFIIHIGPFLEPTAPSDLFRLEFFELIPADRAGDHPVARISAISGISAFELTGLVELEATDFERVAEKVREANRDLLAMAPGTGSLLHFETSFDTDGVVVQFAQLSVDGAPLPGRGQRFHFAPFGELLEIENNICQQECE